jgi:hypothetical protein
MNMDKQIVILDANTFKNVIDDLDHLSKLMDDMIVDMHNVKGGQQVRHSYMLYRKYLWDIKDELKNGITHKQQPTENNEQQ